jgi:hypothetical protein
LLVSNEIGWGMLQLCGGRNVFGGGRLRRK